MVLTSPFRPNLLMNAQKPVPEGNPMSDNDRPRPLSPAGEGKGLWLSTLERGAKLLQDTPLLRGFDVCLAGSHPAKDDPSMQMEAHH